jgi:hypothetical protein
MTGQTRARRRAFGDVNDLVTHIDEVLDSGAATSRSSARWVATGDLPVPSSDWTSGPARVFDYTEFLPPEDVSVAVSGAMTALTRNRLIHRSSSRVQEIFISAVSIWREETAIESSASRIVSHPAYQRIIGLGPQAVPLILEDLRDFKGLWFPALVAITGIDPAEGIETSSGARQAWIRWGVSRGLIDDRSKQ